MRDSKKMRLETASLHIVLCSPRFGIPQGNPRAKRFVTPPSWGLLAGPSSADGHLSSAEAKLQRPRLLDKIRPPGTHRSANAL